MSTITTLFGGLALVFMMYAAGSLIRGLPPMLRALLSGLIPLIAYFVLIVGRWPGLDVVTIHISVFLAAALVLFAVTQFRKHGKERMHWAPKLLIVFFIGLVFLNATLLYIATRGLPEPIGRWWLGSEGGAVYSGFSGVVAHGQNAAKAVSSELSETHRESQLGWQVEILGLDSSDTTRPIQVRVRDRTGLPVERVVAELRLQRPGSAATEPVLSLSAAGSGVYVGALSLPATGRWLLDLRLILDGKVRYHAVQELLAP